MALADEVSLLASRVAAEAKSLWAAVGSKADGAHQHPVTDLTATGTSSAETYLRGDGAWANVPSGVIASATQPTETDVLWVNPEEEPIPGDGGGSAGIEGYGFPAPLAASVGTIYTDLDATNGALRWIKTGASLNAWRVIVGDTGWRDLSASLDPTVLHPSNGVYSYFQIRRVDNDISLSIMLYMVDGLSIPGGRQIGVSLPVGLRGDVRMIQIPAASTDSEMKRGMTFTIYGNGPVRLNPAWGKSKLGTGMDSQIFWSGAVHSSEPWPTVLPGVRA